MGRRKCRESAYETDLAGRYVDRVLHRACAKEHSAVRRYVDRLSAKAFQRASGRGAANDIPSETLQAAPTVATEREQPKKTSDEDCTSRKYLWKQVQLLIKQYKLASKNLVDIDEDLLRLR